MSRINASIVGKVGSSFDVTVDNGEIVQAAIDDDHMFPPNADGKSFTIPSLAAGDTVIWLAIIFRPEEGDATVGVANVTAGSAEAANPPQTLDSSQVATVIVLFGEA